MLTPAHYHDPAIADAERRTLFPASWLYLCRNDEVPAATGYHTLDLMGEPLVVTRDAAGTLRLFSNVCRHRAGPVCHGTGERSRLTCAYHGWTYDLAGQLTVAPEFDPCPDLSLPEYEIASLGPWLFGRLEGAVHGPSFAELVGEMRAEIEPYGLDQMTFIRRIGYPMACNWKVYIENYLEPYHLPRVHPALHAMTDYARYQIDCRAWHVRQLGPPRLSSSEQFSGRVSSPGLLSPPTQSSNLAPPSPERVRERGEGGWGGEPVPASGGWGGEPVPLASGSAEGAAWYWAFPNFILNCSFGVASTNLVWPTSPTTCTVIADFYAPPSLPPDDIEASIAFSDAVQAEDITICEAVQRGLESRDATLGPLHPSRELAVVMFQGLVCREDGL